MMRYLLTLVKMDIVKKPKNYKCWKGGREKGHSYTVACVHAQSCLTRVAFWPVAYQIPLSMGLPRQEYWSGSPFPLLGDLPDPGIEPTSPALQMDSLPLGHQGGNVN